MADKKQYYEDGKTPVPSYDHFSQLVKKVEQLEEAGKTIKDQELIIKKLKRRRICDNQKTEARKEHINELIDDIKGLKEELARRGRLINELKSQRKEANEIIARCKERIQWRTMVLACIPPKEGICDSLYWEIENYENKWGVK